MKQSESLVDEENVASRPFRSLPSTESQVKDTTSSFGRVSKSSKLHVQIQTRINYLVNGNVHFPPRSRIWFLKLVRICGVRVSHNRMASISSVLPVKI